MNIMVTGSNGMIGSQLVDSLIKDGNEVIGIDRTESIREEKKYKHYMINLDEKEKIRTIVKENHIEKIVHLAALAHTEGEPDLSWNAYYHINVECAKNIFESAGEIPVLFISTIDVYGFYDGKKPVDCNTAIHPVSNYGKSKAYAEEECKKLLHYNIFRFSPVYTDDIKRDIQKRYYLKFPNIAYKIGKGSYYEILNINKAVIEMKNWCFEEPDNSIRIIKDEQPMWTPDYIRTEKQAGRARITFRVPRWIVISGYYIIKAVFGENAKTYLLNKAVFPLRSQ